MKEQADSASRFADCLHQALKNITDLDWLGENSPLAAPYFLSSYLLDESEIERMDARGRGRALQQLIRNCIAAIPAQADTDVDYARLLDLHYLQGINVNVTSHKLGIGRATFFRHAPSARKILEEVFTQHVNPALRLETPSQTANFVGRDVVLEECQAALHERKSVALTGASGIGKTALAEQIVTQLGEHPVFWFTIQTGINDRLDSLLFALAYFLHEQGAKSLWLQLVADKGQLDMQVVPALLRDDLAAVAEQNPILVIDEVDLLRPAVDTHAQLLNFIESLPTDTGLLLIGQHVGLLSALHHELAPLSDRAIQQLLQSRQIDLTPENFTRLVTYTLGNPRLLTLYIVLHDSEESLDAVLAQLSSAPSMEGVINRVWQRLAAEEHNLLADLAIYRRAAPDDAWADSASQFALHKLAQRQLVHRDGRGGVMLIAAFKEIVYNLTTPENRETLHLAAADVRAERGEYTAAAYHFVQAQRPDWAVEFWYPKRQEEINQGQGRAALALFGSLSKNQLSQAETQERLILLRAELRELVGDYTRALVDLRATVFHGTLERIRAKRYEGDFLQAMGDWGAAEHAYKGGQDLLELRLETEAARFHRDLAWVHYRQQELAAADYELQLARHEIANQQGMLCKAQGETAEAQQAYEEALAIAKKIEYRQGQIKSLTYLANLSVQLGEYERAIACWDEAFALAQQIGRVASLANNRVNRAVGHNLAGNPHTAIPLAEVALQFFARTEQHYGVAIAAQVLAESYLALEKFDQAEEYVRQVISTEDNGVLPDAWRVLGKIRLAQDEAAEARRWLQQAIDHAQANGDAYLQAYSQRDMSDVLLYESKTQVAEAMLNDALTQFDDLQMLGEVQKTQERLDAIRGETDSP